MQITKHINFMGKRKIAMIFSAALILLSVGSLVFKGLNLGVDFTGGTVIQVGYPGNANIPEIRETLKEAGYDAAVQPFGTAQDVLIRLPEQTGIDRAKVSDNVLKTLRETTAGVEMRRVEFVGPQIGDELRDQGGIAMLLALAGILIYIALRFEFRFAVGSIVALVHDVILTIGFFSITGIEINETLSRTLVTSFTTLLVLVSLFVFGGEIIHGFSIAMIVGIIVGTYSSIYVASSSLLAMGVTREALLPPAKDDELDEELDAIP